MEDPKGSVSADRQGAEMQKQSSLSIFSWWDLKFVWENNQVNVILHSVVDNQTKQKNMAVNLPVVDYMWHRGFCVELQQIFYFKFVATFLATVITMVAKKLPGVAGLITQGEAAARTHLNGS